VSNTWRDRLAWRLCNFILQTIATKEYRYAIGGLILEGLDRLRQEARDGSARS
jgi:hypothetical protein